MPARDLPTGTAEAPDTAKSYDEAVEDISNLLGDPDEDPAEDDEEKAKAGPDDSDEESDGAEDVETDDAEDPDGSEPEVKGGRFAPDSAKVTLEDGTVITVAELKRNNLFQRDYTKKTTEHSEAVKAFEAERQQVSQYAQSLSQFREYAAWFAENHMPKRPEPFAGNAMSDPAGYLTWSQQETQWQRMQDAYNQFQLQKQAEDQNKTQESQIKGQQRLRTEAAKLADKFPVLNNPEKRTAFWSRLEAGAEKYFGITADEVRSVGDHRMIVALHAAVRMKQVAEKAPQVKDELKKRPQAGKRLEPQAQGKRDQQARTERLRREGTFEAGVSALESFNL
jgi:hypothetical protein